MECKKSTDFKPVKTENTNDHTIKQIRKQMCNAITPEPLGFLRPKQALREGYFMYNYNNRSQYR